MVVSCKKNTEDTVNTPCKVSKISFSNETFSYEYSNGKIKTINHVSGSTSLKMTLEYASNSVLIKTFTSANMLTKIDTIYLDSKGSITKFNNREFYTVNAEGYLQKEESRTSGILTDVFDYSITNANYVTTVHKEYDSRGFLGQKIFNNEFYLDKANNTNLDFTFWDEQTGILRSTFFKKSKNYVSYANGYLRFTYELNNNGNASKIIVTKTDAGKVTTSNVNVEYECN